MFSASFDSEMSWVAEGHCRVLRIMQVCERMMPGYGEQMRAISLK